MWRQIIIGKLEREDLVKFEIACSYFARQRTDLQREKGEREMIYVEAILVVQHHISVVQKNMPLITHRQESKVIEKVGKQSQKAKK